MLTILSLFVLVSDAAGFDGVTRPVGPQLDWDAASLARFDAGWLHVKFVEGAEVGLVAAPTPSGLRFAGLTLQDLADLDQVLAGARTLRRTFPGLREKFQALKLRGEAASGQPGPDLSLWFDVELAGGRAALADALNALNALSVVEIAHPAPICEPAVLMSSGISPDARRRPFDTLRPTPDFTDQQDYLFETPVGLDAPSAWAVTGGRGAGMKFMDVELGWIHMHEDFDHDALFYNNNNDDPAYRDHGTAVLGEVVAMNNDYGVTGFASDSQWGTVGILYDEWPDVPHRFREAAEALDPGDVWLIELQMYPPGKSATPMEWLQANFDAIWTSCWSMGVVCVEAGANGSQDLDDPSWDGVFDRDVRDSGAIMVGAGTPTGRVAEWFTNYGSRMDNHAWGSEIVTTGYGDLYSGGSPETEYTGTFGGTSGASPMVVGSALCMQGIALERFGSPLAPDALRTLLHETGIENLGTQYIGPRPDLGAAVEELLSSVPGDLNGDRCVDQADLGILLADWGCTGDDCVGDIDGDGNTGQPDLGILLAHWGDGCG
jgi:serine protease